METMTNTERKQLFDQMISKLDKEINYCNNQIEAPMLLACNCIVATDDAEYQIGVDENHKGKVLIGDYTSPCFFSENYAKKVANEVKASNGYGPLKFVVWGWKSFYKQRRDNLLTTKESILSVMETALEN